MNSQKQYFWKAVMTKGAVLFLLLVLAPRLQATSYYVDSVNGNDANSGTAPTAAWQTLDVVNNRTFQPGDLLLFKAGGIWTGQLNPKGSGSATLPIVIDMYGNGPKPIIDGNGVTGNGAVFLFNQSYWELNNLEVTNDAASGGDRRGIYLSAANFGTATHLYVRNCYIHNVKGIVDANSSAAKRTGGIIIEVIDDSTTPTRFDDVRIENSVITTVDNEGIAINNRVKTSDYPGTTGWDNRKITRLLIRNNSLSDIAKNAMIIRLADETGLIEHNVVWNTAFRAGAGNTIYTISCRGTVFQHNEGYLNKETAGYDGSLYDSDLQSPHVIFQYSYSHDNNQGLYWMATTAPDDNITVRYNISQNDKGRIFSMSYPNTSTYVYNNTIYIPSNLSPAIIDEKTANQKTYYFYNNIFYNESSTATYQFFNGIRTFSHNIFYGFHPANEPSDANKLTSDPLLEAPGTGGLGLDTVNGYKLKAGSPAIDSGMTIANDGGLDFFGNKVPYNGVTDRGGHEWTPAGGDFSLSASPSSQTEVRGSSVNYTVSSTSAGDPTIALSVDGLPNGAIATFNPTSLHGSSAATMTVSTNSSTPTGTYTLRVSGNTGSVMHAINVTLVVGATSDFSLSATPTSQTVVQGSNTAYTIGVPSSGSFGGAVALSASGLPSGASASFNPSSVTSPGSSTMTVTASSNTRSGGYTLTVTGTSGSLTHTTTATLVVKSASLQQTTAALASSANPSAGGQKVTFTASVSPSAASGSVQFFDGSSSLGTATLSGGAASVSTATLTAGSHSITAKYNGDANFAVSTSAVLTQTVNAGVAQPTTLLPVADAYVRDGSYANTNYGLVNTLATKSDVGAGYNRWTYLKFDLSGITGSITSSVLRLYGGISNTRNTNLTVAVYAGADTTWSEAGITWNNRPPAGASILATATVANSTSQYFEWDLTPYIQAANRGLVSIVLQDTQNSTDYILWNSREATSNQPQLVIR